MPINCIGVGAMNNKAVLIVAMLVCVAGVTGCGATITVSASRDGVVTVSCNAKMGEAFMQMMRPMGLASGTADGGAGVPFLTAADCADMQARLLLRGLENAAVSTPTNDSVLASGKITLAAVKKGGKNIKGGKNKNIAPVGNLLINTGCINVAQAGSKQRFTLALNKTTLGALYKAVDEEVQTYLDLTMAGVFSGENMTADDWISALGMVYGKPVAGEAAKAVVTVKMSVEGKNDELAERRFTVPLSDIMTGQNVLCQVEG